MVCYKPLTMYWTGEYTDIFHTKKKYSFSPKNCYYDAFVQKVPCGQCIGCRLERSRQWAIRCVHEAGLHKANCFLTLTYSPEFLPAGGTLVKKHVQDFLKRLRKHLGDKRIRYYMCGEYGEKHLRPHYHICLFGHSFPDKEFYKPNNGYPLYTSPTLSKLWPFGWAVIGSLTFETAAYTARYIMKKQLGKNAQSYYDSLGVIPEYTCMSRRPGIANSYFEPNVDEMYRRDFIVIKGKKMKPPKYYDKLFDLYYPECYSYLKLHRKQVIEGLPERDLYVAEKVKFSKIGKLLRPIERSGFLV